MAEQLSIAVDVYKSFSDHYMQTIGTIGKLCLIVEVGHAVCCSPFVFRSTKKPHYACTPCEHYVRVCMHACVHAWQAISHDPVNPVTLCVISFQAQVSAAKQEIVLVSVSLRPKSAKSNDIFPRQMLTLASCFFPFVKSSLFQHFNTEQNDFSLSVRVTCCIV